MDNNPGKNAVYSCNLNYFFNKQYFDGIEEIKGNETKYEIKGINERNRCLFELTEKDFGEFPLSELKADEYNKLSKDNQNFQYVYFDLITRYPGLLIGLGNPHEISATGVIKLGFSFDYVTGLPYLPGSSLKGILRSYFPNAYDKNKRNRKQYATYILEKLNKEINSENIEMLDKLETEIFDKGDLFIGAYVKPELEPESNTEKGSKYQCYLGDEYITHHESIIKEPNPVKLIKILPNVRVRFYFGLNKGTCLDIKQKAELFKSIILDMGAGAKTNVGYGQFTEVSKMSDTDIQKKNTDNEKRDAVYEVVVKGYGDNKLYFEGGTEGFIYFNRLKQVKGNNLNKVKKVYEEGKPFKVKTDKDVNGKSVFVEV